MGTVFYHIVDVCERGLWTNSQTNLTIRSWTVQQSIYDMLVTRRKIVPQPMIRT